MVEIVRIYEAQRPEPSVSLKHLIKASYINEELQNEAKFTGSVPQIDKQVKARFFRVILTQFRQFKEQRRRDYQEQYLEAKEQFESQIKKQRQMVQLLSDLFQRKQEQSIFSDSTIQDSTSPLKSNAKPESSLNSASAYSESNIIKNIQIIKKDLDENSYQIKTFNPEKGIKKKKV